MMDAKELIKWNEVSVVLTGNPFTVRPSRVNKKHAAKIEALLEYVQNWIDRKGNVKSARVTVKIPETQQLSPPEQPTDIPIDLSKKTDYIAVEELPHDRRIVIDPEFRGIYASGSKFYTNKVTDGKRDIRQWSKIEKAKAYLKNLK